MLKYILSGLIFFVAISGDLTLRSGPMLGYSEMREVSIWLQTFDHAKVQIEFWKTENKKNIFKSKIISTNSDESFTAKFILSNLSPGTEYEYRILVNNKKIEKKYPLKFKTQQLWQFRTEPPEINIAFGSCYYVNETEFDRPGTPYGTPSNIFQKIVNEKPDAMLWIGDNVYYRDADWYSNEGMKYRYSHTREQKEIEELISSTNNYAIWDDHDFGRNDDDRSYSMKDDALEIFKLFWPNKKFGVKEADGVFHRFQIADIEFFMLDDRFHRSPNSAPNDSSKTMFGKIQLAWLKDCLLNSAQPFKIIVGGNQMLNKMSSHETFAKYSFEQNDLISFIKKNKIRGVLFLSGDRHHTELICEQDSSFYPLYDYTNSSLTAGLGNPVNEYGNPDRIEGTLVFNKHNFGLLKFSGKRKERKLEMVCIDKEGTKRWSFEISEKDLIPKK